MKTSLAQRRKEFNDAIKNLSWIEMFFAGIFFTIAPFLPFPGTGRTTLVLITAYAGYRRVRKGK